MILSIFAIDWIPWNAAIKEIAWRRAKFSHLQQAQKPQAATMLKYTFSIGRLFQACWSIKSVWSSKVELIFVLLSPHTFSSSWLILEELKDPSVSTFYIWLDGLTAIEVYYYLQVFLMSPLCNWRVLYILFLFSFIG